MLSDVEIMVRVQAGETSLFAELVQRHQAKLLRFALSKTGDLSEAEDMVQEAFLAAFHARESYRPDFAFSTWIWTITLNLTRTSIRKNIKSLERMKELQRIKPTSTTPDTTLIPLLESEQSEILDRWLSTLPDVQGDAIRLKYFGGLKFDEIALAMDCTVSGAKRRVKVGLLKLAELAQSEFE